MYVTVRMILRIYNKKKSLFCFNKMLIFMAADQKDAAHVTYSVTHGPTPPRSIRLTSQSSPGNSSALERKREARNENTTLTNYTEKKNPHIYSSAPVKHTHTQNKLGSIVIKRPGAYNYSHRLAYVLRL